MLKAKDSKAVEKVKAEEAEPEERNHWLHPPYLKVYPTITRIDY